MQVIIFNNEMNKKNHLELSTLLINVIISVMYESSSHLLAGTVVVTAILVQPILFHYTSTTMYMINNTIQVVKVSSK